MTSMKIPETCGCGNAVRYQTANGWSCNKHHRCLTREEAIESLRVANMEIHRLQQLLAEVDSQCGNRSPSYRRHALTPGVRDEIHEILAERPDVPNENGNNA